MTARRRHPLAAGLVVLMLLAGAAGVVLAAGGDRGPRAAPRPTDTTPASDDGTTAPAPLPRSQPAALTIPSMGLDTRLAALDAAQDGLMELPPVKRAGWYTGSVTPGEVGVTIVAGYIRRSADRPGIFKDLRRLHVGDRIAVARADGSAANYLVTRIESYDKGAFPAQKVYAGGTDPELRIVTVGGALKNGDPLGNVVVFARYTGPASDTRAEP